MNIEGNEQADNAAKAAAEAATSDIIPFIRLKSAQCLSIQAIANNKWKPESTTSRQNARRLRNMSQCPDITRPKLYDELQPRKLVVCSARLRTGLCRLNEYLHGFNIIETPQCECGAEKEMVEHYLLNYELFDRERDALRKKGGVQGMTVSHKRNYKVY